MKITEHPFYAEWKPAEDSLCYRVLCDVVKAETHYDECNNLAQTLAQIEAECRNDIVDVAEPTREWLEKIAIARLTAEIAQRQWQAAEAAETQVRRQRDRLRLELKQLENRLVTARDSYRNALQIDEGRHPNDRLASSVHRRTLAETTTALIGYEKIDV